jgi:hypothetical protein
MSTPARGNFSELAIKPELKPEVGFDASGLSPDEAERFAAAFKPSWEFDDAPFTQVTTLPQTDLESLEAGGVNSDVRRNMHVPDSERSQSVPAHAPPVRVETQEPEVSVIIDRSLTASPEPPPPKPSVRPVAPVASPFAAQLAAAAVAPNRIVAPVARSRANADESLELPASLKKSNKGLFIGLGAAVAAAALVFAVRAATSGPDDTAAPPTATATAPIPSPPSVPAPPAATPVTSPALTSVPLSSLPMASPSPVTPAAAAPPQVQPSRPMAQPAPKPAPHAAPPPQPHHTAPRPAPAPKATGGGIVRDNPF